MNYREISTWELLKEAAKGWKPTDKRLAIEIVQRWEHCVQANAQIRSIEQDLILFYTDLSEIHLRGTEGVVCFFLSGNSELGEKIYEHHRKTRDQLCFIFPLSDESHEQARRIIKPGYTLLISPEEVRVLFRSGEGKQFLKAALLQHIPRRKLIPYNIMLPAETSVFFGRQREIARLGDEVHTSFAIAGPGRIGKTSLLLRYKLLLGRRRDAFALRTFYINFYECGNTSPDGTAKFLAKRMESTRWSDRMTADQLINFLRYQAHKLGGTLNLLLDEVDEVCQDEAFNYIAVAAREGYCRLILCGRGVLLKTMMSAKSALESRLDLIRLESLDERSARDLLLKPMGDLGFELQEPDRLADQVLRLTGRMPHLLHLCGMKLTDLALEENVDAITIDHVNMLKWDFVLAQYFITPLKDIEDLETRLVALLLLKQADQTFSIPFIQKVVEQVGINLDYSQVIEICNDLLINNVLGWQGGSYRLSNEGLQFYAREMGFLDRALRNTIKRLNERSKRKV